MPKLRIEFNREPCIGTFGCMSNDPDRWEKGSDGKAVLKNGRLENGKWVAEVDVEDPYIVVAAAESCPVNIIKVFDAETVEELLKS